jgi:CIC family chloride channel protein
LRLAELPLIASLRKRPPGEKRFLALVPVTGLVAGLSAVAVVRLLAAVQRWFWGGGRDLLGHAAAMPWWGRVLAPAIGGALVGAIIFAARRSVRGSGAAAVIESVARKQGSLAIPDSLVRTGAALVTVGAGGSLGREGPMMRLGGAFGSYLGRRFGLSGHRVTILLGCGAAAGIAAAYNAPIGGAMFALEVLLGNFALESFGPIVVASAIGTVVARAFLSKFTAYAPPPHETLVSAWEIGHYLVMGLLIGLVSAAFIVILRASDRGFDRIRLTVWLKPVLGFTAVGVIAVWFPQVLGNGFDTVNLVLHESLPLTLILLLPALKIAATALTRGSGGAGGVFTPTLFIGAVLGSAYGSWCQIVFPGTTSGPGAYALVGMGAMVAGTTQVPLTAIMIIFELTGDYEILVPLMVACTMAIVASRLCHEASIYTEPLVERGIRIGGRMEELVMDSMQVRDIMRQGAMPVPDDEPLAGVMKRMLDEARKELFVVGRDDWRFRGTITLAELSEHFGKGEALKTMRARDILYPDVPILTLDDRLSEAMERWSKVSRDRLPVVDAAATRRFVGELSAGDIISLYSQEILHKEARLARFDRPREGGRPETTFVELPSEYVVAQVTLPETFAPMTLRDLAARQRFGVNIIEIKRPVEHGRERRIIPDPATDLRGGDALIVVGRPGDIAMLGDPARLAAFANERKGEGGGGAGAAGGQPPDQPAP